MPLLPTGNIPSNSNFTGYLSSSELPSLPSRHIPSSTELRSGGTGASSDFLQKEINHLRPGSFGLDDVSGGDPKLLAQRGDAVTASVSLNSSVPDVIDRPSSLGNGDGAAVSKGYSNILFVDGLPTNCTRREVGHIFRPFIGYKDIKVIHKEPRRSGDRAMVLCFVEFVDSKCALTAMEALQGYKFDDKKPESPSLKIQFAHFPFQLPSDRDEQQIGIPR